MLFYVFVLLILSTIKVAGDRPYSGKVGPDDVDKVDMAYRVVADHIRTLSFAITDGSYPAKDLWLKFLPSERVLPFGCKDNFWEMGDTGPCGPCTEIHFDRIGNHDAASLVNNDYPTLIEIWNLVFIRFNRESDVSLNPLPTKHVDTGMGFERLTSILQNKMSNYDTDVFIPIFNAIQERGEFCSLHEELEATGARPYSGKVGPDDVDKVDMAYRVVADHIRTLSFAITDGSYPGNEGREYVLRRILHRAVRYGTEVLKANKGFFNKLVKVVVEVMGNVFPELKQYEDHIVDTIASEEKSFGRTLVNGIEKFKKAARDVKEKLSGQDAFLLWDTYGFPLDLTLLMAEERGLTVDVDGYNKAMNEARERSRNAQNKKELEMQFKMNRRIVAQCRQKCEAMQGKFTEKLEQVHTAYQKLEQEMESLSKDKQELQEKFSEKSRQKRKLDEMYDQLRCEYESIKSTAIQPANSFYPGIEPHLFASTANMMPNRDPFKKDWPAYTPDTPGPREDIWPSAARQNSSNSGPFDVSAGSPVKQSAGPTDFSNRRGINRTAFGAGARSGAAAGAGNPSMTLRNLIISPIKRPQLSPSRPQMFT
ncbi:hypothetical protein POM88_041784 [Heracleum sosnowskyi]|uniref:alanine--tRNA ligase n=1 Tax=Heracleum sosnowskyi TaxID=360622 RepID=A0AAD8HHB2_9APIA|nr:hypothetical protein POM88_041784 [Heracleum sosnowskyi]